MILINRYYICYHKGKGAIAQLVEQRTENPCVPGSIPGSTTNGTKMKIWFRIFFTSLSKLKNTYLCFLLLKTKSLV